jgi:hypothetical protein
MNLVLVLFQIGTDEMAGLDSSEVSDFQIYQMVQRFQNSRHFCKITGPLIEGYLESKLKFK